MKSIINWCRTILNDYSRHNISRLSAETTYYIILSIVPFLIIALTGITVFLNHNTDVLNQLVALLPPESQHTVTDLIDDLTQNQSNTLFSVGILMAFWTLSASTRSLINALNTMFHLDYNEENIFITYGKALFFTFIGAITGFLGLVLSVYGQSFLQLFGNFFGIPQEIIRLASAVTTLLPLVSFTISLTLFYHFAPRHERGKVLSWKRSFAGGLLATILWLLLTVGYRFYITNFAGGSATYGPLVGIMILFIWINLSVQTILLSAEIIRNRDLDPQLKEESIKKQNEELEEDKKRKAEEVE
ncbi:YihY/virulence factor BrkB family protein [Veillonella sp. R32]|uniref:YihY/virulence factor BrkB family protein n=1 Tax=Veillonella sp. R32 TaxID=2021312 RepID=UPI00138A3351|nr:YihY/virulence factor BrkB family protein [Veillonella sp. R32]KAF1682296.1 hypothetical protein VER_06100 [Veillonella sp. R32]